jgi:pilus assembly protein CpaB
MPFLSTDLLTTLNRWPRRIAALTCLILAAGSAVTEGHHRAVAAAPATQVVIAARPIPVGASLVAADLSIARWPRSLIPAGTVPDPTALVGHRVAGAVGRGEAITRTRLLGADLAAGLTTGQLAVPVTVADPNAAALIRPGDQVALISVPDRDDPASAGAAATTGAPGTSLSPDVIAADVRVLAIVPVTGGTVDGDGVSIIVATDRAGALRIAGSAAHGVLAVRAEAS